jgi:predicted dienelactone hydrolase
VIFSHGFGGCAKQSGFLTAALAARGYFVVAPNHRDAICGGVRGRDGENPTHLGAFRTPERWSDTMFADRRADIVAIIDALRSDTSYGNHLLFSQIGLVGHSLGGYTVMGLGGAWPSWRQPGVKAILALSPYAAPFLARGTLSGISAPVMYQGGTLDIDITPSLRRRGGAYDASPVPKYFVEFQGAGHFAWTQLRADFHEEIVDYSIAFLDYYVKGLGSLDALHRKAAQVADLRYREK